MQPVFQVIAIVLYFLWLRCCAVLHSINKGKGRLERPRENNQLETAPDGDNGGLLSMKERTDPDPGKETDLKVNADAGHKYDVFLSFRGSDYRETFINCLYSRLKDAAVETFIDDEELRVGEEIGPELMKAIKQSKISIPIFSKNYASSKWCLKEVAEMVRLDDRKHIIMPIFLDVTPDEVQHQTGSFAEAFTRHEVKYDFETVQEWRCALWEVTKRKGLELEKETKGKHGEFINLVVARVLNGLKKDQLNVDEILVGIDDKVEAVKSLLEVGSGGFRIAGIWGMGGIGKTTLAKVVYNQILDKFQSSCFLNDIRESSKSKGLAHLQSKLVSDILHEERKDFENTDEGIIHLRHRLVGKKAIILLDDVDHIEQLKALAGNPDWFGPGSRIIITTREKKVLDQFKVSNIYEVMPLSENQALELFCKHAFLKGSPTPGFVGLSRDVVSATGMLPLALEVIGSSLFAEIRPCEEAWRDTLKKLRTKPKKEVQDKLKISYDSLDVDEKQIFLDIACLFVGMDSRIAIPLWDDCGFFPQAGIEILLLKSLIKITKDNKFWMHDQLRDLGREIVEGENYRHPGRRSRLWRPEEAIRVLNRNQGTADVEAITLEGYKFCLNFEGYQFRDLSRLRILELNKATLGGNFEGLLADLRWLSWHFRTVDPVLPTNLDLKNLIVLDLSRSTVSEDWAGWSLMKVAAKLKVLNLTGCLQLRKTPDFSAFQGLERLILCSCHNLLVIDPSIEQLTSLVSLDTRDCSSLLLLPQLGSMGALTELLWTGRDPSADWDGIVNLPSLPSSLISLRFESRFIQAFPNVEHLTNLEELHLKCSSISLVPGLQGLVSLRSLKIECSSITHFGGFETLGSLRELEIRSTPVGTLLDLSKLKRLSDITLEFCEELRQVEVLGELESLERLTVRLCGALEKLPDLSKLHKLQSLSIVSCRKITEIQGLGDSESLEWLEITECEALENLPNMSKLRRLNFLKINWCINLPEIVGVEELDNLESLDICTCHGLEKLPNLSKLHGLQTLNIASCNKITEVAGLGDLESLQHVNISDCEALESLPNMSKLQRLVSLGIKLCPNLAEIAGLEELDNLENLHVFKCEGIERLPDLSKLRRLQTLRVDQCEKITEIRGLGDLESLEVLHCNTLVEFPSFSKLQKLRWLDVPACDDFTGTKIS